MLIKISKESELQTVLKEYIMTGSAEATLKLPWIILEGSRKLILKNYKLKVK